ncbi:MAG TPA: DUF1553 domain-containing protein, partial [Pirellulales bacterium]|nr:DUF1553 domain-containing protein [Pirellulales bacterium]
IKELEDKLEELESIASPFTHFAMGVRDDEKPVDVRVLDRGDLANPGREVPRGLLTILKPAEPLPIPSRHSGRFQLAHWISSAENPLTARVFVNRVWDHLFGRGLVDTVDNFGALGNVPSHPELLDALAVGFVEQKWSVKKLIRWIVLSRVYQLSSRYDATNYTHDPDNRLLWRMPHRALGAEEIRDAMLAASGQLNLERPAGSEVLKLSNKTIFGMRAVEAMDELNVRSVYLPILRGIVPESLQVFDVANPSLIVGKRDVTIVPTQALYLMNNSFVLRQAGHLARRILSDDQLGQAARIELAYRLTLGRSPTDAERSAVAAFLNDYRKTLLDEKFEGSAQQAAWASLCQTLFAAGQFRFLY